MTIRLVIGVMVMSAVAAACQAQQDTASLDADVAALEKLVRAETAAANTGDLEALLDLRTADAVEMLPGESSLIGKDAIRAASGEDSAYTEQFTNVSTEEVRVIGDWGFIRISFVQTLTPISGGEPIVFSGRTLLFVQRQPDKSWKIALEMVNSNKPSN